jgi:hypothetical protein
MKTGKTPYEIRSDLLQLAYSIVRERKMIAQYKIDSTNGVLPCADVSVEEIIAEAEKLNGFVSHAAEK